MMSLPLAAFLFGLGFGSSPAQEERAFTQEDLRIRVRVPAKGYTLRTDPKTFVFGWKGSLCELAGTDGMVGGALLHFASAMKVEKYARWREEISEKMEGVKSYKKVKEVRPTGKAMGERLIQEHTMEYKNYDVRYATLFIADKRHNFELVLWTPETVWSEYRDAVYAIFGGVQYGDLSARGKELPVVHRPKGKAYRHPKEGFDLWIPEGWEVRNEKFQLGLEGTVLEFRRGENLAGVVGFLKSALPLEKYAEVFLEGMRKAFEKFEVLGRSTTKGGALRRDCRIEREGLRFRYVTAFASRGGKNFFVMAWMSEADWKTFEGPVNRFLDAFAFSSKTGK